VLSECLELPAEQLAKELKVSFGSIYGTIAHLYQADSVWLNRIQGLASGTPADYSAPGCTFELRDAWLPVQDKLIAFADELAEDEWQRELSYTTFSGVPYRTPIWQTILHVVNHGTHHRGQITAMLRQLGTKPENLDLIGYYRAIRNS
jgi:uncharacterized damage-inducible protein DinB